MLSLRIFIGHFLHRIRVASSLFGAEGALPSESFFFGVRAGILQCFLAGVVGKLIDLVAFAELLSFPLSSLDVFGLCCLITSSTY